MKGILTLLLLAGMILMVNGQTGTRWRGPDGNGIYPESGLLKKWPSDGPEILWTFEELGKGHSSAVISDEHIYVTGMLDTTGFVFKLDMQGNAVWKKAYGPEYNLSFYGSRGSVTVAGNKLYLLSGNGKLVCMAKGDGNILWSKELFDDFDGSNIRWGVNETPVVDGDIVYATPGGSKNNVIALNRHSGNLVWSSKGKGQLSAYCTPLLFTHKGLKILATHTASSLIGLDAATGKMLWSVSQPNQYAVHANTPMYHEGELFYSSGYGKGGGLLKLSDDGSSVKKSWYRDTVDNRMGGFVLLDGRLYLSGDHTRNWKCVDWKSGEILGSTTELRKGDVISADGMLYIYTELGELALVEPGPDGFKIVSKTRVIHGSEQHWAHPVIHKGTLYVRHGKALIAYAIK